MTMVFQYRNTTGSPFSIDLGNTVVRFGKMPPLMRRAELGQVGTCGIEIDDDAGSLDLLGLQWFSVMENALSDPNDVVIYNGSIGDRTITRGDGDRRSLRLGASRIWTLDLDDDNALLGRKIIRPGDGSRPAETGGDRLTWLLGLSYAPMTDTGLVVYPTNDMDAVDYTGQTFRDVLADIAAPNSYNFWVRRVQTVPSNTPPLFFDDPASTAYSSSATISNVLADKSSSCFMVVDSSLRRSAARVASGVYLPYSGGSKYVTNSTTRDNFTDVDHVAPMANVKSSTAATAVANAFLAQSTGEDDRITCVIRVPVLNVLDIRAGHRVQAKFSHFPGYTSLTWCRVLSLSIAQDEENQDQYKLGLELSPQ